MGSQGSPLSSVRNLMSKKSEIRRPLDILRNALHHVPLHMKMER